MIPRDSENKRKFQEAADRWMQDLKRQSAISRSLVFALILSIGVFAPYLVKKIFPSVETPAGYVVAAALALVVLIVAVELILIRRGVSQELRNSLWYAVGVGLAVGVLIHNEGQVAWAIVLGLAGFVLTFGGVYLVAKRSS
ncbi:MAG: hypothetical protein AB1894_16985 [Chloroflexota bacterium]